jgi:hypothetical protein
MRTSLDRGVIEVTGRAAPRKGRSIGIGIGRDGRLPVGVARLASFPLPGTQGESHVCILGPEPRRVC